jgi:hypothetical protein
VSRSQASSARLVARAMVRTPHRNVMFDIPDAFAAAVAGTD